MGPKFARLFGPFLLFLKNFARLDINSNKASHVKGKSCHLWRSVLTFLCDLCYCSRVQASVNILLVDDYPANLIALSAVLTDPAYHPIEVTSGEEALKVVEEKDIALILLDIQMPGMDGYAVAEKIRSNPRTHEIPIIFITAVYREDASVLKGYAAGAQDYLGKPFDPEILKAKVSIYSGQSLKIAKLERERRVLQESEERYRLIVEGAQEIIATFDTSGTITSLNMAFERLTGLRCDECVGKSFVPLILSKDVVRVLSHFGDSERFHTTQLSQTEIRTALGKQLPVEISVQPLMRGDQILGTVGVIRDITARGLTPDFLHRDLL